MLTCSYYLLVGNVVLSSNDTNLVKIVFSVKEICISQESTFKTFCHELSSK